MVDRAVGESEEHDAECQRNVLGGEWRRSDEGEHRQGAANGEQSAAEAEAGRESTGSPGVDRFGRASLSAHRNPRRDDLVRR
ncbi:hypothetical protein GCM10025298_10940 [Natronobiforma cellulositropha]